MNSLQSVVVTLSIGEASEFFRKLRLTERQKEIASRSSRPPATSTTGHADRNGAVSANIGTATTSTQSASPEATACRPK